MPGYQEIGGKKTLKERFLSWLQQAQAEEFRSFPGNYLATLFGVFISAWLVGLGSCHGIKAVTNTEHDHHDHNHLVSSSVLGIYYTMSTLLTFLVGRQHIENPKNTVKHILGLLGVGLALAAFSGVMATTFEKNLMGEHTDPFNGNDFMKIFSMIFFVGFGKNVFDMAAIKVTDKIVKNPFTSGVDGLISLISGSVNSAVSVKKRSGYQEIPDYSESDVKVVLKNGKEEQEEGSDKKPTTYTYKEDQEILSKKVNNSEDLKEIYQL